jgi:hypothetical protein
MKTSNTIFTFTTIRNHSDELTAQPQLEIQPRTNFVTSLIDTFESDQQQSEKIASVNQKLDAFIKSGSFFKTKSELAAALSKFLPKDPGDVAAREVARGVQGLYDNLYDNIVMRTISKSTTDEVYKLLTEGIKNVHLRLNGERLKDQSVSKLKIIIPERLVLSFSPPAQPRATTKPPTDKERAALFAQVRELTEQKQQLRNLRVEHESRIASERQKLSNQQAEEARIQFANKRAEASETARTAQPQVTPPTRQTEATSPVLDQLLATAEQQQATEREISDKLVELNRQALEMIPDVRYAKVGDRWVNVSGFDETRPPIIEGDTLLVFSHGCYLKFPFKVADLHVIEQETVGYRPGEIAHINNTQPDESYERITERLERIETFESLLEVDETLRETDSTSVEKQTVEKAASEVQSEEMALNVNTSVSGTYGVVTASLDAGFSTSQSSQNANSSSQTYAQEIMRRVVDSVSRKVQKQQSRTTLNEFRETVKHVIDNTKSSDAKSYVFRFLQRLIRGTLKNLDLHLFVEVRVPHPSHYYLSQAITETPALKLPPDPRELNAEGHPLFTVDNITRENYLAWAVKYNAKLEAPPEEKIIVSYVNAGKAGENSEKSLQPLTDGYCAVHAYINRTLWQTSDGFGFLSVMVGRGDTQDWIVPGVTNSAIFALSTHDLHRETKFIPISVMAPFSGGYALNIEIECELTDEGKRAWQVKCYNAILEAYDAMKAAAENQMSDFDPNRPGLDSTRKRDLIKSELKKGVLSRMFRCNPFWITDNYEVGKEYDPDCCKDTLNAEQVRFLETLFNWDNITYELHPYMYADKDNWARLLDMTDDDPHFEAFLQASFATVWIPVYRDSQKETAAINFIMYNSIANYAVVPEAMKSLLEELESGKPTKFTTGLNGEQLPVPIEVVDLGIFNVPTNLVILECGVENGVKPIGFPQKPDLESTDVAIPKQYSPAIIADRCTPAPAPVLAPAPPALTVGSVIEEPIEPRHRT